MKGIGVAFLPYCEGINVLSKISVFRTQLGRRFKLTCPGRTSIVLLRFTFLLICASRYSHASSNIHGSGEGMISSSGLVGVALPCQSLQAHRRVHWKMDFLHKLALKPVAAGNVDCLAAG